MAQGVRIPLTMTDQTRGAVNAARNNVKRLSMDAQRAGQSIGRATGQAGSIAGRVGSAMGSSVGGRLGGIGGALGGMMALGPLGLAIGGAAVGLSMFTKELEKGAEAVQNQLAGERAMRSARERGQATIEGQQRGAAGRLGTLQDAAAMGIRPEDLARGVPSSGLSPEDLIARERARQGGMSETQLYSAFVVASMGMGSMDEALKAAKSLGRNAAPEDILLRMRGQQLSGSARAGAAAEISNVASFRFAGGQGMGATIQAQQRGQSDAFGRDITALRSGSTRALIDAQTQMENDPMQAEAERALKQLERAYTDAWEANKRLYDESGTAARLWRQAFGDETARAVTAARAQLNAAQAQ